MFKVQSLLHREGFLDADKTEGPTGYWGMFDHEAIEKFQKENDLKVDGWMGPGGESIKAFENIYAPAKGQQPQQTQQPTGQLPWKDYSGNLLDNDAWDALLSRLPAWYRPEPRQDAGQTETLSGGNGADDAAPMQLAQQEDKLQEAQPQPQSRQPRTKQQPMPQIKPDFEIIERGRQEMDAIKNAKREAEIAQRNALIDDYLDDPRVQAFLDTLGQFESRGRYDVITGGGRFTDMSEHPNKPNEKGNTATGKYQFTKDTWDEFSRPVGAKDFSPISQDRVAIYMLQRLEAIERLLQGDIDGAIMNTGRRWAAFPKDSEGRNIEKNGYRPIAPVIEEYKKRLDALQGRKP